MSIILIISIPNVLFVGNVYSLLQRDRHYEDAGILDRTHLRFFTKRSIVELVEKAGLTVEMICPQIIPYDEALHSYRDTLLACPGVGIKQEDLEAYQWILTVRPREDASFCAACHR